ncbi:circadian clock KaiB family protein [Hymenobacter sp. 5414T-23]|uniref:circadian clock KaiB family protein n=1 Tax=Hymenobacter sp. 5414T-23 TaxID=2932252 RepID=UPI001FD22CFF|nr:circadian clock KaiB family protein [Hymenobacter sp. 5414T-23]UOQ79756.1 circadian clock KaiB family protein [Hymenobacter sp. 5414T-23]
MLSNSSGTVPDGENNSPAEYVLHLYITGATPNSTRAVRNIKAICERHLQGRYELLIIDIYQQPNLAKHEQIIAAPTLVKKLPLPLRRLIGDLSEEKKVLAALGLPDVPLSNS